MEDECSELPCLQIILTHRQSLKMSPRLKLWGRVPFPPPQFAQLFAIHRMHIVCVFNVDVVKCRRNKHVVCIHQDPRAVYSICM